MTSPSQPLNIGGGTRRPGAQGGDASVSASQQQQQTTNSFSNTPILGTPDLRALRAQYAGTPPPPNIPLRGAGGTGTPTGRSAAAASGGGNGGGAVSSSPSSGLAVPGFTTDSSSHSPSPLRPSPQPVSGLSATRHITSSTSGNTTTTTGASSSSSITPDPAVQAQAIMDLDDLPAEEKAKVLERHLVGKEQRSKAGVGEAATTTTATATPTGGARSVAGSVLDVPTTTGAGSYDADGVSGTPALHSRRSSASARVVAREDSEAFPIPYHAPGADVTHDIYKWHTDQRRLAAARVRSASFAGPSPTPHPAFEHIHEPGGFRRNYLLLRANEQGEEGPRVLNNFIDFLLLFGHFAGEDLEEDDDEDKDDDDEESVTPPADQLITSTGLSDVNESTALLSGSTTLTRGAGGGGGPGEQSMTRSRSRSRRRKLSVSRQGTATVTQAVLMLLKSFVGTGVLFLGRAFYNGGLLFSIITFTFIAFISLYSFLLLVKTKFVVSGSFGDIGGTLYGPWMRYLILGSIVVSQIGFVAAYTIFVAENLQAFVMGVTNCLKLIPVQYFILVQLVVFLPLVLIRDLAKLSSTALVADAFILCGLVYIFGSEVSIIADRGVADVKMFNPRDFSLFIGTAVFSFEGIGLVIPITDSMREPHKFPKALTGVMIFLLLLFGGAGTLAYLTFGSEIKTVVLVNLDPHSKMVQSVQLFYALAILLSVPLQLFPAIRILENGIFTRSGKADTRVKWLKNSFRFAMVFVCTIISWIGAADLDKFVAFVGCFACVPLCYVYPAMLHYKACSRTRKDKLADIALIIFGLIAAAYTTTQTIKLMFTPSPVEGSPYGNCETGGT